MADNEALLRQIEQLKAALAEKEKVIESLRQSGYNPEWYQQNKTTIRAAKKVYYAQNRAHIAAQQRGRDRMKAEFKRFCAIDVL